MEEKKITVIYNSDTQFAILSALVQSFEGEGVNMDKFLFWVINTIGAGSSICLRQLVNKEN